MQNPGEAPLCSTCKQSMEIDTCWNCQGNGEVRQYLFWKRMCPTCKGSGKLYSCHRYSDHIKIFNEQKERHQELISQVLKSNVNLSNVHLPEHGLMWKWDLETKTGRPIRSELELPKLPINRAIKIQQHGQIHGAMEAQRRQQEFMKQQQEFMERCAEQSHRAMETHQKFLNWSAEQSHRAMEMAQRRFKGGPGF